MFRREQIVAAARTIVAEGGVEALTFGALEGRLGFTRGVITYHFKNKDEVVEAVLASAVDEIDGATLRGVQSSMTPEDSVRAVIRSNVFGYLEHPEASKVLISFWSRLPSDRRAARLNARLYETYRSRCALLIETGKRAGRFRDVSSTSVAALIVGAVIGIVTQHYFLASGGAREHLDTNAVVDEACAMTLSHLGRARRLRPRR